MGDRILMNTLYSLSDTTVDNVVLERAFNERIREVKGDTSVNQYKESVIRLTDSLIKNVDDRGTVKIAAIHPSVNDYLFSEITLNCNEQIAIIENAVFYEQIFRALKSDTAKLHYRKKLCSYDFLKINTLKNTAFSLERAYGSLSYQDREEYGQILQKLYSTFLPFYCEALGLPVQRKNGPPPAPASDKALCAYFVILSQTKSPATI